MIDMKSVLAISRRFIKNVNGRRGLKTFNASSYVHGISTEPLLYTTIGDLLKKQTEKYADRTVFAFPRHSIEKTYAEFDDDVSSCASGFIAMGLEKGDRVGIWSPNVYEWVVTQFATAKAGLILTNINPAYRTNELQYCLRKVGVKCLISANKFKTQDYFEMISEICPMLPTSTPGVLHNDQLPNLKHIVFLNDERQQGAFTFKDVSNMSTKQSQEKLSEMTKRVQPDDGVNIQFTSGTTGTPKGALLSHFNIINNAYFVGKRIGYDEKFPIICCPPPLYHCFGCVLGSLCAIVHGGTCVFPAPSFEPMAALKAVQDYNCNSMYGTPTMFIDMLNQEQFDKYNYSTLSTGIMAGAPCPIEVCKQVVDKMHMKEFAILYGTTENSPGTFTTLRTDDVEKRVHSVGQVLDHVEAKVVDHDGHIVPINHPGELHIRGNVVFLGYWNDVEKTEEVLAVDKWYHTGDLALMDENKYVKIVGRQKDVIIRGGENIYPTEIEEFLFTHPKIIDVHVIGVPDQRMGEEVCVWIRLHAGETCTEAEIREFCKGNISHYKIPRYILFKHEKDFPLTVTGKVQKYKMREIAKHELNLGHVKGHFNEEINQFL